MTTIALTRIDHVHYRGAFHIDETASTLSNTMDEKVSDEILMKQYQNGDNEAFSRLFIRHRDPVFRYLERQCVTSIAEEIFQDVWLKLIQAKHQFNSDGSNRFAPYLYRIAHNRLMDYFRHNSVKTKVIIENNSEQELYEISQVHGSISLEAQIDSRRKLEKLLFLVDQLPDEQRQAFLLKEESGFSIQDIADVTGVNRETAKSRLRYAFQRIREGMRGML